MRVDMMAILKRCTVMIFGKCAFHLRLPSQAEASPIHCIQEEDLHVDLFTDRDKPQYAKYKVGIQEHSPALEEDIEWEQNVMEERMQQLRAAGRPETYLRDVNSTISSREQEFALRSTMRVMPSSPSTTRIGHQCHIQKPYPSFAPIRQADSEPQRRPCPWRPNFQLKQHQVEQAVPLLKMIRIGCP